MRPTKNVCTGYVLHFYDAGLGQRGSDKFYRSFYYRGPDGAWFTLTHWGRDLTTGQYKTDKFLSQGEASDSIDKKRSEKIRKGYELIGSGQASLNFTDEPGRVSAEFAQAVAQRDPDKSRMTGGIVILEEPDYRDLMDELG